MSRFCNVEFTKMDDNISHKGIIEKIEGDRVFVRITQQSACSGCHAKSMCTASEQKVKIVEVQARGEQFSVNEMVEVCARSSVGLKAVWWAFVLPLIGIVVVVVAGSVGGWRETWCGLAALGWLVLYYYVLYLFRDKLKRKFVFFLKRLNTVS